MYNARKLNWKPVWIVESNFEQDMADGEVDENLWQCWQDGDVRHSPPRLNFVEQVHGRVAHQNLVDDDLVEDLPFSEII